MTPFKPIIAVVIIALAIGYFIYPDPPMEAVDPKQLPWHITLDKQQRSTVLGLTINQSTLQDAVNAFGEDAAMALYAGAEQPSIEVYFAYVKKAGLTAKVIITLDVTNKEAEALLSNANSRMQSNSAIPKIDINPADRYKALAMKISSITYIPKYSGLDQSYLIDRFGIPSHRLKLSATATQLFYKSIGLSVISDSDGKEVFQYAQPSQLIIPTQAVAYESN